MATPANINGYGLLSARPTSIASTAGALYYATDTGLVYRDNGAGWNTIGTNAAGTTAAAGLVQFATNAQNAASRAVQGNDARLPLWCKLGAGTLIAASGDGNPITLISTPVTTLTPTALGQTVARAVLFRPPFAFAPAHLYVYGRATLVGAFVFAIYPFSAAGGGSKVWDSGNVDFTANAWTDITSAGTPALNTIALTANTDYLMCVSTTTTSASSVLQIPTSINPQIFGADTAPFGALAIGVPHVYGLAVTAGAFPGTQPAVVAPASTSANGPMVWMSGTSS